MKLFLLVIITILFISLFFCQGCQSTTQNNEELRKENTKLDKEAKKETINISEDKEPITCVDWLGYYGEKTRQLDNIVKQYGIKVKSEGPDKYNSPIKLEGAYVLKEKDLPIEKIRDLAQYLAYKLCLSNNKEFQGALIDCQKRKVQVVIARNEKNYSIEAWAVVYNIFPGNKKGELIIQDLTK